MSKSRQCKKFKEKELKAKRCARKNPETQVKGENALKNINKSRQCKEFKDKELDAKRCSRKNPETQEKSRKAL